MKKTIALVLCLLMVVSLAACGGQATADESSASAEQTETVEPTTEETEQPEESSEPAFDTSWAGDEYVMPIPEPPFTQFEISGADHEYQIISTNESEIAELTRQDIIDYCKILQDLGFTIDMQAEDVDEGSDTGYQFEATNADGVYCYIAFMESRQAVYILIQTEDVENEIGENDTTTSDEESGNTIEESGDTILKFSSAALPDLEWTCEEKEEANGKRYLSYEAENVPQDVVEDFVEQLKAAGYTLYEESVDEAWCFWGFSNDATEGSAIIGFSRKHGKCQIDIFGDF